MLQKYQDIFTNKNNHVSKNVLGHFQNWFVVGVKTTTTKNKTYSPTPRLREKLKLQLEDWFKDEVIEPFTLIIPLTQTQY